MYSALPFKERGRVSFALLQPGFKAGDFAGTTASQRRLYVRVFVARGHDDFASVAIYILAQYQPVALEIQIGISIFRFGVSEWVLYSTAISPSASSSLR